MFRKRQPFHDHLFLNGQSPLGIKSPANKSNECMIKLEGAYEIIGNGTFISLDVAVERKAKIMEMSNSNHQL